MARNRKYQDFLIEELKDHNEVIAYLNAALEESLKGGVKNLNISSLLLFAMLPKLRVELEILLKRLELEEKASIKHFQTKAIPTGIRLSLS